MSIIKLVFLALIAIFIFNYFDTTNEKYDGTLVLPINTKILAFGDSITYGYRVDSDKNYPSVLSNLLQSKVINAGRNGETTKEGLKRLPGLLKKHKPQILIICEGANDLLRSKKFSDIKKNLADMIKLAQKQKIFVVLVGVPYLEYLRYSTANFYYDLAQTYNVPFEDNILEKILNDNSLKVDEVHPNAKGYELLSNALANIITTNYVPSFSF
ncbi:MAG: arylesterase [Sulfurospirillum sp.]